MTTTTENVFVPDNQAVSPRLKLILETGEADHLPRLLDLWPRSELLQAKKDLRRYYHASRHQLEDKWKEMSAALENARAASRLGRAYQLQQQGLARVCAEIEDEIERALERNQEAL